MKCVWNKRRRLGIVLAAFVLTCVAGNSAWAAKNVILMIADGSGFNTWRVASLYQGKLNAQVYDLPGWQHFGCSTYPLIASETPTGNEIQDHRMIYDPLKAWDTSPIKWFGTKTFAGYKYLKTTYTESPSAATAMATGRKSYRNAINWLNGNHPLRGLTIAEIAKAHGKRTGVITSVEWSDATPAGFLFGQVLTFVERRVIYVMAQLVKKMRDLSSPSLAGAGRLFDGTTEIN